MTPDDLCHLYLDQVYRFAAMISRDRRDAEDLAQEAILRAVRGLPSFSRSRGAPEAWLWRIVVNTARDLGRIDRRRRLTFERWASLSVPDSAHRPLASRLVMVHVAPGTDSSFTANYVGPGIKPVGPQSPWPSFLQPTVETASGEPVPQTLVPGKSGFGVTNSNPPVATATWTGVLPGPGMYQISCAPPASGATTATIQLP